MKSKILTKDWREKSYGDLANEKHQIFAVSNELRTDTVHLDLNKNKFGNKINSEIMIGEDKV